MGCLEGRPEVEGGSSYSRESIEDLDRHHIEIGISLVTPDEKRRRRAFAKTVDAEAKRVAKARGWKFSDGFIFRERVGWFIELPLTAHLDQAVTSARLHTKPIALDPVFWDIVGLPDNVALPLSFRAKGAWTCTSPEIAERVFEDADVEAAAIAERAIGWADEQVSTRAADWTLDGFIDHISKHHRYIEAGSWLAALTAALIIAGRIEVARHACLAARERGIAGGFSVGGQDFPAMALAWMERSDTHC